MGPKWELNFHPTDLQSESAGWAQCEAEHVLSHQVLDLCLDEDFQLRSRELNTRKHKKVQKIELRDNVILVQKSKSQEAFVINILMSFFEDPS